MDLQKKLKLALNDNRLLILGTQVLFGFQFNGIFQELFVDLPYPSRVLETSGLTLLMVSIAFLIAPSMHHRLVESGQDNARVLRLASDFAGFALLPLTFALAFDMFVTVAWTLDPVTGATIGAGFFIVAILSWYVLGFLLRSKKPAMAKDKAVRTPLDVQVDQLLTEARLIIPGAQALLGFQFAVTLMRAFAELPEAVKMLHVAALCCIGLAVIMLMAPASIHRIAFGGEDDPAFVRVASFFVVAAPLPLAFGIALDTFVAAGRALQSDRAATLLGLAAIVVLLGTWYMYPLAQRLLKKTGRP
ncbi:MAG: DUF6328 family protein [Xanthobacteraceae bacterium]